MIPTQIAMPTNNIDKLSDKNNEFLLSFLSKAQTQATVLSAKATESVDSSSHNISAISHEKRGVLSERITNDEQIYTAIKNIGGW